MKTKTTSFGAFIVTTFVVLVGLTFTLNVSPQQLRDAVKVGPSVKTYNDYENCKFVLSAAWTPVTKSQVSLFYRAGAEKGSPSKSLSPWTLTRLLPCNTPIEIYAEQIAYAKSTIACSIHRNRQKVSEEGPAISTSVRCTA